MKVTFYDPKIGELKLHVSDSEDLWHLSKVLAPGDEVESATTRTYKVGNREEKKNVKIRVKAEQIEFSQNSNRLRVLGSIIWGEPEEYVQTGRYHTIEVAADDRLKILKGPGGWKQHEIKRLRDAEASSKKPRLRIIVLDDEKALNAILRSYGVEYGAEFYSSGSKRDENYAKTTEAYFEKIAGEIQRHPEKFLIAGPGFTKDNLKDYLAKKHAPLLKKIIFESVSYAERSGVTELFKQGIIEKIMGEERFEKEMKLIDEFISALHRGSELIAYGPKEVKRAADSAAIKQLLVIDDYLRTDSLVDEIVLLAEKNRADITIFAAEGDPGLKLKGFGKIAAFLRFKIGE
ncbi:mRNA surveillance protein pelota [Candidatus Micrarchaeota archaeon]|nr:mRNA surveillance protein pelota [Candidatus Micrarchaeota archaeon]